MMEYVNPARSCSRGLWVENASLDQIVELRGQDTKKLSALDRTVESSAGFSNSSRRINVICQKKIVKLEKLLLF